MGANSGFWRFAMLLILSSRIAIAQHQSNIHALADKLYANNQFNGAILVVESGECVLKKAFGTQGPDGKDSLELTTPFNLGEASGTFTAMAIAILQDRGLLDWDDRVARHLQDLPYQNIRIRDLLWHTSGLPDYFLLCEKYWDHRRAVNNHDLIELIHKHQPRLLFPRGMNFEFSNTNYALLALIVERVSKQSFANFVQKEIFAPLKMEDAFVYRPFSSPKKQEIATGFRLSISNVPMTYPPNYLDGIVGDKGIYASINDMQKWLMALQSNRLLVETLDGPYLQAGSLENGATTFYAMGWVRVDTPAVAFHDGAWRGFHSTIVWYTKANHAIVLLSNRSDRVVHMQRLFSRILEERPLRKPWPTLRERLSRRRE
jgi:CubicO group peptidase (beta-lactamase class C family)